MRGSSLSLDFYGGSSLLRTRPFSSFPADAFEHTFPLCPVSRAINMTC